MPVSDGRSRRQQNGAQDNENAHIGLVDELLQPIPQGNLARGVVWADILADIAADEEARQRARDLPDAA